MTTEEKKHDEWNKCGRPDILFKNPRPVVPEPERQRYNCELSD